MGQSNCSKEFRDLNRYKYFLYYCFLFHSRYEYRALPSTAGQRYDYILLYLGIFLLKYNVFVTIWTYQNACLSVM